MLQKSKKPCEFGSLFLGVYQYSSSLLCTGPISACPLEYDIVIKVIESCIFKGLFLQNAKNDKDLFITCSRLLGSLFQSILNRRGAGQNSFSSM